jgi:hypothetical protein
MDSFIFVMQTSVASLAGSVRNSAHTSTTGRSEHEGGQAMKKLRLRLASWCAVAIVLSMGAVRTLGQDATFVGSWDMTMTGGGEHGGGENRRGGGGGAQSLTIAKDGDKIKVTHKTPRGEKVSEATVSGNTISWTEERPGRDGNSMKIEFKATLEGDTLKGTAGGGQFSREFTAKRAN